MAPTPCVRPRGRSFRYAPPGVGLPLLPGLLDGLQDLVQGLRLLQVLRHTAELGLLYRTADRVVQVEPERLRVDQLLRCLFRYRVLICVRRDLLVQRCEAASLYPHALG